MPLTLTATTGATLSQAEVARERDAAAAGSRRDCDRDLQPFDAERLPQARAGRRATRAAGRDASDPFELYDLPLDDDLDDAAVAARVDEVWGVLAAPARPPQVRGAGRRCSSTTHDGAQRRAARRRAPRRWPPPRGAARRASSATPPASPCSTPRSRGSSHRHGGVPRDKVAGLDEVGALGRADRAEVAARLRRHRVVDGRRPPPRAEPAIGRERRRQMRALLDEFGRLTDGAAAADPARAARPRARRGRRSRSAHAAAAWRARARELPPERLRAVVDELLVHVAELLEPGGAPSRPTSTRSPRTSPSTCGRGCGPRCWWRTGSSPRTTRTCWTRRSQLRAGPGRGRPPSLAALAAELGRRPIEGRHRRRRSRARHRRAPGSALRAQSDAPRAGGAVGAGRSGCERPGRRCATGRAGEARRLVARRGGWPGAGGTPRSAPSPTRSPRCWPRPACAGGRGAACAAGASSRRCEHLEHLARTASDVPRGPPSWRSCWPRARAAVERADARGGRGARGPGAERAAALLARAGRLPGPPGRGRGAGRASRSPPPAWVNAARDARGDVVVLWARVGHRRTSRYKVSRRRAGRLVAGGRPGHRHVGRATAAPRPAVEAPVYAVAALQAGPGLGGVPLGRGRPAADRAAPARPASRRGRCRLRLRGSIVARGSPPATSSTGCAARRGRPWRVVGRTGAPCRGRRRRPGRCRSTR